MPSLSDRLKSLGVKVGARDLTPPVVLTRHPIEKVIEGHLLETALGEIFLVDKMFPPDYRHGSEDLYCEAPLELLCQWAGEEQTSFSLSEFAFLDTETSGLAGGTGTFAFLIGVGRFEGSYFHQAQFFMRDPTEEPALLLALESFLAPCKALVTFNGKTFDAPLLNTRFSLAGWRSPLLEMAHVDLLHIARRLWRDRLPSRTLGNLEVEILHIYRTEEEVPGWMIPQLYFDYLRTGDARPMKNVFYHNSMDVVSLAALFKRIGGMLANPLQSELESIERAALGRLYEEMEKPEEAMKLYETSLRDGLPEDLFWDTLCRLAHLHKQRGDYTAALSLWEKAAKHRQIYAFVEIAKVWEHVYHNYSIALEWTQQAIQMIDRPDYPATDRSIWLSDLMHRHNRLTRKINAQEGEGMAE